MEIEGAFAMRILKVNKVVQNSCFSWFSQQGSFKSDFSNHKFSISLDDRLFPQMYTDIDIRMRKAYGINGHDLRQVRQVR